MSTLEEWLGMHEHEYNDPHPLVWSIQQQDGLGCLHDENVLQAQSIHDVHDAIISM